MTNTRLTLLVLGLPLLAVSLVLAACATIDLAALCYNFTIYFVGEPG